MLVRVQWQQIKLPWYVKDVQQVLKSNCSLVCKQLDATHQSQKRSADASSTGKIQFQVGHVVWLFISAVKRGLSKKLSSLWRGDEQHEQV